MENTGAQDLGAMNWTTWKFNINRTLLFKWQFILLLPKLLLHRCVSFVYSCYTSQFYELNLFKFVESHCKKILQLDSPHSKIKNFLSLADQNPKFLNRHLHLSRFAFWAKRYDVKEWGMHVVYWVNKKFKDCNSIDASSYPYPCKKICTVHAPL